jgi:hypothetical protein
MAATSVISPILVRTLSDSAAQQGVNQRSYHISCIGTDTKKHSKTTTSTPLYSSLFLSYILHLRDWNYF